MSKPTQAEVIAALDVIGRYGLTVIESDTYEELRAVADRAKTLADLMESLVKKPGQVTKSWERPLPFAVNGLHALADLRTALAALTRDGYLAAAADVS